MAILSHIIGVTEVAAYWWAKDGAAHGRVLSQRETARIVNVVDSDAAKKRGEQRAILV
jgi:hypothetical protein